MGANGSHPAAAGGGVYQSSAVVPYGGQQSSVQFAQGGGAMGAGGGGSIEHYGSAGPLGVNNPNMVWDDARGGYWVKETIVDQGSQDYDSGGGYTVYGGRPGKIIKTRTCCEEPEPNYIIHNHKKIVNYEDSDDEITINLPPPVVVMPQQPPTTNVFILPCPEKPKPPPSGPTTFFPEVREKSYRLETQTRTGPCQSAPCVTVFKCGPCGGQAPPSCGRCRSYH